MSRCPLLPCIHPMAASYDSRRVAARLLADEAFVQRARAALQQASSSSGLDALQRVRLLNECFERVRGGRLMRGPECLPVLLGQQRRRRPRGSVTGSSGGPCRLCAGPVAGGPGYGRRAPRAAWASHTPSS